MSLVLRKVNIKLILGLLVILNFIDLMLTLVLFEKKLITEENPIMDVFISFNSLSFALAKLSLCYFGIYLLYKYRENSFSIYSSYCLVGVYLVILFRHIQIITCLL